MSISIKLAFILFSLFLINGCVNEDIRQGFDDQHYKTSIALIELYKIRNGAYPDSLNDIKFIGDWDNQFLFAATYKEAGVGYTLNLKNGGDKKIISHYPKEFWNGVGIQLEKR